MFVKPKRKINKVFIHCSASDNPNHDDISVIEKWHRERGFAGVGYHYFIQSNGNIQTGRNIEIIPAAQVGHNAGSIAICLHGLEAFKNKQFSSLRQLCGEINKDMDVTFHGHCEVSNKLCPNFDYRGVLGLDKNGKMFVPKVFSGGEIKDVWKDNQSNNELEAVKTILKRIIGSIKKFFNKGD